MLSTGNNFKDKNSSPEYFHSHQSDPIPETVNLNEEPLRDSNNGSEQWKNKSWYGALTLAIGSLVATGVYYGLKNPSIPEANSYPKADISSRISLREIKDTKNISPLAKLTFFSHPQNKQTKSVFTKLDIVPILSDVIICDAESEKYCVKPQLYPPHYSEDSGIHWQTSTLDVDMGFVCLGYLPNTTAACGTDLMNCVVVGGVGGTCDNPIALRSGDRGKSWTTRAFGDIGYGCSGLFVRDFLKDVTCDETGLDCTATGFCSFMNGPDDSGSTTYKVSV